MSIKTTTWRWSLLVVKPDNNSRILTIYHSGILLYQYLSKNVLCLFTFLLKFICKYKFRYCFKRHASMLEAYLTVLNFTISLVYLFYSGSTRSFSSEGNLSILSHLGGLKSGCPLSTSITCLPSDERRSLMKSTAALTFLAFLVMVMP